MPTAETLETEHARLKGLGSKLLSESDTELVGIAVELALDMHLLRR